MSRIILKELGSFYKVRFVLPILIWMIMIRTEAIAQNFWEQTNGPYVKLNSTYANYVVSVAVYEPGFLFAGTYDDGIYHSKDGGNNWKEVNSGLNHRKVECLTINSSSEYIFAGTEGDAVYRSTVDSVYWLKIDSGLPNSSTILSLAFKSNHHIFAGTNGMGIFHSVDNGDNWTDANKGLTNGVIYAFAVNKADGSLYAGTDGGGIFRFLDSDVKWSPILTGSNIRIFSLAINTRGYIFAGTIGGIYRSIDDGDSWTLFKTGLPNSHIKFLTFNASEYIFAGSKDGIFRSKNDGNSWMRFNTGLTDSAIYSLSTDSTGRLFAGTASKGVFRAIDAELPVIEHLPDTSANNRQEIPIDVQATDDTGIKKITLSFRRGGELNFDSVSDTLIRPDHSYTLHIPSDFVTDRGVEYYITASDSFDNVTEFPNKGYLSVQVNVDEPGVAIKVSLIAGSDRIAYRLVSVPLELNDNTAKAVLEDDLGKYDNKKWRFYELRDDYFELPDNISPYREYNDELEMESGKAYWLIVKEEGKYIDTGPAITFLTDIEYEIALHQGWNFIGNPFNFSIPIRNLQLKNKKAAFELKHYEGQWVAVTAGSTLEPFAGLALFADSTSSDTLMINPDLSDTSASFSNYATSLIHYNLISSIRIMARCQQARDGDNLAVIASDALIGKDRRDQPEPPVIGKYVSVYFLHRDWNSLAKTYCIDARPEPRESEIWEFEVKTNIRDKVDLSFEGLESVPEEFEVWLLDEAVKITRDLRQTNYYSVAGMGEQHPKQLKLVIGKQDFVEEKLLEFQVIPENYELSQNFPNPFNPATTIRYGLPRTERETLKVYNLLGEEVVTLVDNEQQEAGYHVAIWDGRNRDGSIVANGVYIYRLQAGSSSITRKMTLLK